MKYNYLYIAVYSPQEGNFYHWALSFETETSIYNFEVIGQFPNYDYYKHISRTPPEKNHAGFIKKYLVAEIDRRDVKDVIKFFEDEAEARKDILEWNCQDFCLESLEELRDRELISGEDEYYEEGVEEAKEYYGPA
ncbi:hypothetical protein TWF679_007693 [Orbilia oligospora]|uniref:Uncharacterized protein n=1 Tax=Orbilia oligospora TaxID=2813651 RepID=A0A8H8V6U6_ORBOL|nr:hypothetical protein TWF679_007693 [Orbilia oligospora]